MLKALIKTRLLMAWQTAVTIGGKRKNLRLLRALILALMVFFAFSVSSLVGMIFSEIARPFHQMGLGWFYFALAGITAFSVGFISSIFMAQPLLFQAKDNDLLLCMPIPPGTILISRMAVLYILNLLIILLVMLPAGILWAVQAEPLNWAFLALICLSLPLMALALSALLGWILALISSRFRSKTLVSALLSICLMLGYFVAMSQMNSLMARLISAGPQMAEGARRYIFPAYHLGLAAGEGNPASLLYFLLTALIPFALVWLLLRHFFIRIVTANRGRVRTTYVEKPLKATSPTPALVKKELRLFFGSTIYMLNSGFSLIFMLALPALLMFKPDILAPLLNEFSIPTEMLGAAALGALCLMASAVQISAPSLSLEGKTLWIAQSLPVRPGQVLLSKAYAHMLISLPVVVISGLALGMILQLPLLFILLMVLVPGLCNALVALSGILINLKFPKFDWSSQTEAVKQSISVLITMMVGFLTVALPAALYLFLLQDKIALPLFLLLYALALILLCLMLFYRLGRGSDRDFLALHP